MLYNFIRTYTDIVVKCMCIFQRLHGNILALCSRPLRGLGLSAILALKN
jgi:hypothetical protein